MPTLKDQLRADLTVAMKARDEVRTRTLRMALTSITTEEVSGAAAHEISDDDVIKILMREAKRRREAATAFADAGRTEQAAAERAEEEVLAGYLPAQLGDDELTALVTAAIAETGASGPAGIGQVMKAVTPRVAGRAEGSRVAAIVRSQLSSQPGCSRLRPKRTRPRVSGRGGRAESESDFRPFRRRPFRPSSSCRPRSSARRSPSPERRRSSAGS